MYYRKIWVDKIRRAWKKRSLVWLSGVRRVGKTTLTKSFQNAVYINCDLPSSHEILEDPEFFYKNISSGIIIFDEIHQLNNPSMVLKIGTDVFPHLRIIATGSSTLTATKKFRDSLTGRKTEIHLTPVLYSELPAFHISNLKKRLLYGGLPEPLLSEEKDADFYSEWMDSFYARDIQELFRVDKRYGFLKIFEMLLRQNGELLEITSLSKHTGLARPTVMKYIEILQLTYGVFVLRPFHGGGRQELLHQPKVYGFDTGFVTFCRGWESLREEDCGKLWENLVLDTLLLDYPKNQIFYWRTKKGKEIDFVIHKNRRDITAIECKWNHGNYRPQALRLFREFYPEGENIVTSPRVETPFVKNIGGLKIRFTNLPV